MNPENIKKILETGKLTERRRAILIMRLEGKTLEEIGHHFGITRERVRQIIANLEKSIT